MAPTVLIVDDDAELRILLSTALEAYGLAVHQAGTLEEARVALAEDTPDLAVIDGFLPDGSGIAFIQELRDQGRDIKLAFLSALWRSEDILRRLTEELRVTRILHKPMSVRGFVTQVLSCVDVEDLAPTFRKPPTPAADDAAAPEPAEVHAQEVVPDGALDEPTDDGEAYAEAFGEAATEPFGEPFGEGFVEAPTEPFGVPPEEPPATPPDLGALAAQVEELEQMLRDAQLAATEARAVGLLEAARERAGWLMSVAASLNLSALVEAAGRVDAVVARALEAEGDRAQVLAELLGGGEAGGGAAAAPLSPEDLTRVLVVSPDPGLRAQLRDAGDALVLDLVLAADPDGALERAQRRAPDVALLDLCFAAMPAGGGKPLIERLRALDGLADLPVGFLAEDSSLEAQLRAVDAGGAVFLTRPVDMEGLTAAVRRLQAERVVQQPRVLVVDDDPSFCEVLNELLRRMGLQPFCIHDPRELLPTLDRVRPALVVIDALMPQVGGMELVRLLRASATWSALPVIMLTGLGGEEIVLEGLSAGADDVLTKGTAPTLLLARIRHHVDRGRMLQAHADADRLTGLPGRRAFTLAAEARLDEARRWRRPFALGVLSVPALERLAAEHGQLAADKVMIGLARALDRELRVYDLRGRWASSKLVFGLPEVRSEQGERVVERLRRRVQGLQFLTPSGARLDVEVQFGLGAYPEDGRALRALALTTFERLRRESL
ncbi:MAG: response regulator [Alphaproteobacteria bacterium]|nr:response regulator [Alphaproteobacteria bacterium]